MIAGDFCDRCRNPGRSIPDDVFTAADVTPHIYPEGDEKVNDQGRTHPDKGRVNEVLAHLARSDAHFFAEVLAHTEGVPLDHIFQPVL